MLVTCSTFVNYFRRNIFIPVIPEMDDYFNIKGGQLKFSVRFDSVTQ